MLFHIAGNPTILECHLSTAICPCKVPPMEVSYNYVIVVLITNAVILPAALITAFVVAAHIARASTSQHVTLA